MSINRKSRPAGQARPTRLGFGPSVEVFEKRELLTGVGPFIQGTAFVDSANTGTLTNTDATLPGATISLYQGTTVSAATFLESTTTDANGGYSFVNNGQNGTDGIVAPVAGGTYTIVETPPTNYSSTAAQAFSQLDTAKVVAPNEIQVTVASATAVKATYNGFVQYNSSLNNKGTNVSAISFSLNGVAQPTTFASQLNFTLSGDSALNTTQFQAFCIDPADSLSAPPSTFSVVTDPQSAINNGSAVGGEIGYLFNQYGASVPTSASLPSSIKGFSTPNIEAGLQVALWELEYPTTFTLNSPDSVALQFDNATDYAQIQTAAAAFITDATGKSEKVGILDASLTGSLPAPALSGQSVLVGESLNFGNAGAATGTITGTDSVVSNSNTSTSGLTTSTPSIPIAGTTINLLNSGGTVVATTTTNASGGYSFPNVALGSYTVSEVAPTGYNHLGQTSTPVTLSVASPNSTDNFFETASVSVKGSDFLVPANTSLSTGTTGTAIAGTSLTLTGTDEFGKAVSLTTTTASNGSYSFNGLNPTTTGYTVTETVPTTTTHLGQTSTLGTVSTATPSVSSIILTTPGATSTDNFFEVANATISGTVFVDSNGNNKLDGSEPGIGGINVYLYNGAGTAVVAITTTASNGTYSFGNLTPGSYILTMLAPSGYTGETPTAGVSGGNTLFIPSATLELIGSFTVGSGVSDSGNNFGQFVPSAVSGTVYVDANANDKLDTGDTGLGGITVTLLNSSGTVIGTTTSATNGTYSFNGIAPGIYSIQEGATPGYSRENANPGTSAGTPSVGAITGFTITSGTNDTGNNFGQYVGASVSGTVYVDASGSGLTPGTNLPAGTGDTPEAGVTVTLTEANGTKLTTTTASNGTYSFTGLPVGTYTISETVPAGTYQTGPAALSYTVTTTAAAPTSTNDNFSNYMACDSSGLSNVYYLVTTPSGSTTKVYDLRGNTAQGDTVTAYFTINAGSAPEMLSLVAYQAPTSSYSPSNAYQQVITSVATGTFGPGSYSLTVTEPNSYYQVDFVCGAALPQLELNGAPTDYNYENRLISADNGGNQTYALSTISGTVYNDANGNDKLETGDAGIGGVTVYLVNGTATTVLATTTTDSNGNYSFGNLPLGSYYVSEVPPTGYIGETPNAGSNGGAVNFNPSNGIEAIGPFTLNSNTADTSNNFGQYKPVSISGTVYNDNNGNDTLDSGDTGIGGITVYLLNYTTGSYITTTTASNGTYSFNNIAPGSFNDGIWIPSGYVGELPNPGSAGGTPVLTGAENVTPFTVTSGTNATGYNFGQYKPSTISGTVYVDASGSGLTTANQPPANSGDTPEAGVTINAINASGTVVATTTTAANGTYSFNLPIGTYTIAETKPAGTYQTGPNTVTYTVTTSPTSPTSTNDNFANYMACSTSGLSNVKYFVNGKQVSSLGGAGNLQGDTITVTFDNTGTSSLMLSLADYESAYPYFTIYNVSQQVLVGDATGTFAPGKGYSLTVTEPNSYYQVDFVCGAAIVHFGPGGSNVDYGEEGRFIDGNIGGSNAYTTSALSGTVYVDGNGNASFGSGDTGLANVPVTLSGTTYVGANLVGTSLTPIAVTASTTTDANGNYSFPGLAPGVYTITETHPSGYTDETANVGTNGGTASVGVVSTINLNSNTNATGYNFGELLPNASISGIVYADVNRNDKLDTGDTGIGGVQVFLYNAAGTQRLATTTTDSNGNYTFGSLTPGTYQVAEFAASGFTGENPNAGTSGGNVSFSSSSTLAVISSIALGSGVKDTSNNFGNLPASAASLSGIVYADLNYNDVYNSGIDYGISGVTVTLSGKTSYGAAYSLTTTTDCYGNYHFTNVVTGNYTITESQPSGYTPEASNVGNAGGVTGLGSTSSVSLTSGATDSGYNFGSKVNSCSLGNYQTCSTGFWTGGNGQNLINCMNGSSSSTKLGSWLSSMLPNICGSFAGKTNSQVNECFQSLCWSNPCNANIVSTALAAYCTNTSLAGCTSASNYGFSLSNCGAGNCTVNVGNSFSGYGGPCGTTSLFQLLSFADSQSTSWSNGWWYTGSQSSVANCFSSINGCSKIG